MSRCSCQELEDVREALAALGIFVIASTAVGVFSNAALEAMSMNRCIVLSDIGGAGEMVMEGKNGDVFNPGGSRGLAETLKKIIVAKVWEEMGRASRRIAVENFLLGKND